MNFVFLLLTALTFAYFLSELCRRYHIPRVVGQISAGILIGFFARDALLTTSNSEVMSGLADIGIVLLFFFTGFEVNLKEFQRHFKKTILISALNTAIPFILGTALIYLLGYDPSVAIIVGICLAVSSTAISLDFLEEFNLLKTKIGNLIVVTGSVDDLLELIFISLIISYLQISLGSGNIQEVVIGMLAFIGVAAIMRFLLVPFALNVVQKEHSPSVLFMVALILTLSMASISDFLGLGALAGALIAGVIVRHSLLQEKHRRPWEVHEISSTIHAVSFGFLVPLFFVWVGLNVDVPSFFSNPLLGIALSIIAIGGTVIGTTLAILYDKGTLQEGLLVGWGVTAKGDVELAVASLALQNKLITDEIFTALIFMALASTLIAPIVFRRMLTKKVRRNAARDKW